MLKSTRSVLMQLTPIGVIHSPYKECGLLLDIKAYAPALDSIPEASNTHNPSTPGDILTGKKPDA